jgi:hypothetical protein
MGYFSVGAIMPDGVTAIFELQLLLSVTNF